MDAVSLVRPLPWAQPVAGLRFTPERWGPGAYRMEAPGGAHLLVRRHGSPELALWLPAGLLPCIGEPFGVYLNADRHYPARMRAASLMARAIGTRPPRHPVRHPQAHRQAAMLCVHDLVREGASLRDVAAIVIERAPDDWRTSSERSDLRRLADAGARMVAGEYRSLLRANRVDGANKS